MYVISTERISRRLWQANRVILRLERAAFLMARTRSDKGYGKFRESRNYREC